MVKTEAERERAEELRLERLAAGKCPVHPGEDLLAGKKRCQTCRSNSSRYSKTPARKAVRNARQATSGYRQYQREYHLRNEYGLTVADYDAILARQKGRCKICGGGPNGRQKDRFHVDHDHATGKVRGLLCYRCNKMVGLAGDSAETLMKAASYLQESK